MSKIDAYEVEVLEAFEKGKLKSVATKAELARLKAAARATAIKDRRVNIRLSSIDLNDIQVKAMEEVERPQAAQGVAEGGVGWGEVAVRHLMKSQSL